MLSKAEALRLLGCAGALRNGIGFPRVLPDSREVDEALAFLEAELGREACTCLLAEGAAVPLGEAVERSLGSGGLTAGP